MLNISADGVYKALFLIIKNREENLEGLRNYIYFGGNIFDYYNVHVH